MNIRNIKLAYDDISSEFRTDMERYHRIRNSLLKHIKDDENSHEINVYEAFLSGMAYERVGEDE